MMVYVMTLYNTVLATGGFTNMTFLIALKGMWIEYIIIFAIQTFTVVWQVTFASVLGVYHGYGFTSNFIPDYLVTYCKNYVMKFIRLLPALYEERIQTPFSYRSDFRQSKRPCPL